MKYKYRIVEEIEGVFILEYTDNNLVTSVFNFLFDNREYRYTNTDYFKGDLSLAKKHFQKEINKIESYPKYHKL